MKTRIAFWAIIISIIATAAVSAFLTGFALQHPATGRMLIPIAAVGFPGYYLAAILMRADIKVVSTWILLLTTTLINAALYYFVLACFASIVGHFRRRGRKVGESATGGKR